MFLITFSKAGQEDIVLTEDDLFDFQYEASCYSGETFELGGVNAKTLYLLIDNNTQRFSRGTFANCRVKLEIDGKFFGYYNTELPKRRNGVIELTAYDDMVKLGTDASRPITRFRRRSGRCMLSAYLKPGLLPRCRSTTLSLTVHGTTALFPLITRNISTLIPAAIWWREWQSGTAVMHISTMMGSSR